MTTAEAIVTSLEAEGIQYVFGVPGEENLDLLDAIRKSRKITFILTRHEQSAGFMAATVGRLTGKVGVLMTTLGPGATNGLTAVAYAQLGAMPLLVITGQKPLHDNKQGAFQIVDIVDMMQPVTKYAQQVHESAAAPAMIREAIRIAELERPGASHVELPEDLAGEETDAIILPVAETRRPIAETKSIIKAVEMLQSCHKPLFVIGAGANRKRTANMLTEFVQKYNIPFVETQMGKGVINESLKQYAGTAALSSDDYVHDVIEQADLIINIGHDVVEKPPFIMNDAQKVIHINFEPASVNTVYFPQVEVIGDIANAVWQIKEQLESEKVELVWDTSYHKHSVSALKNSFSEYVEQAGETLTPQVIVDRVRKHLDDEDVVALDNGMYKIWFARHYEARRQNTLLLDNALATMGAGVPSALAAKMVKPDQRVIAIAGDGGFMMNSQALETAVRIGLKITIIVLNDKHLQMIRWKQSKMGKQDFGLSYGNPDFVKLAESYGVAGFRAESATELEDALKNADQQEGPSLIDVHIDYTTNQQDLNSRKDK